MSVTALDEADPAVPFDAPLRFHVNSRTDAHVTYVVELDAYAGNGRCACTDFQIRFEPLLRRGMTPAQAVAGKFVRLTNKQGEQKDPADALRCWHLIHARRQFTDDVIAAMGRKNEADTPF